MFRSLAVGFAAAAIAAIAVPVAAQAHNHDTPCLMPTGWYANADELTRLPKPTVHGLEFSGNDLIHHATTGTVEHLAHGTFAAHPAPDQNSFFSVEVINVDLTSYATLRWNTTTSKWNMVTGGAFYENVNPAALVDMPAVHKSHRLLSFGVGYTANPPGTVTTVVSSVRFGGHEYSLGCKPLPKPHPSHSSPSHHGPWPSTSVSVSASTSVSSSASASTSASASASTSTSPSASASTSHGVVTVITTNASDDSGALAVTGPDGRLLGAAAGFLVLVGGAAFVAARRRRTRFTA